MVRVYFVRTWFSCLYYLVLITKELKDVYILCADPESFVRGVQL